MTFGKISTVCAVVVSIAFVVFGMWHPVTAMEDGCTIPPSGPWPPCATGGAVESDDCVIPPSGPWPPCATGGGGNGVSDCIIPPSGPWPPCATGGTGAEPVGTPRVTRFAGPDSVIAGDPVVLSWSVSGLTSSERVTLVERRSNGFFDDVTRHVVPPTGELTIVTETTESDSFTYDYRYFLAYGGRQISAEITTFRDCTWQWYFLPPTYNFAYDGNSRKHTWGFCSTRPLVSQASQQQFERGLMVWIEELDQIWVYNSVGNRLRKMQDVYMPSVDIVSDPSIKPPVGLLQPEFGFGKIWRENPDIRDALGWATAKPVNYQTVDAGNSDDQRNLRRFLRLANGDILLHEGALGILQDSDRFSDLNGYAHPRNGYRQAASEACVIPESGPWPPCATGR